MNRTNDEMRVFLEVRDPAALVDDLQSGRGLFVPTRLPLALSAFFTLGIRLRNVTRTLDLRMIVIGRLADPTSTIFDILREVASGKLVDLEARLQAQVRIAATASFETTGEALTELRALLDDGQAQFPLDQLVQRGDRLALSVTSE